MPVWDGAAPRIVRMELRHRALQVLCLTDIEEKVTQTLAMQAQVALLTIAEEPPAPPADTQALPGHPERPALRSHTEMARRSPATPEGRAVLLHAIAHIEFNAINIDFNESLPSPVLALTRCLHQSTNWATINNRLEAAGTSSFDLLPK